MNWKPISGYEGYYEVSDTGEIRSVDRVIVDKNGKERKLIGKQMKTTRGTGRNGDGYYVVNLHRDGVSKVVQVHSLVAKAFIQNKSNFPTVNHIDGDKTNNCVENLEWVSYTDNNVHALQCNLRKPRGGIVIQKDMYGSIVGSFESVCAASRETGIGRSLISHCVNGRINSAGGFVWEKYRKV